MSFRESAILVVLLGLALACKVRQSQSSDRLKEIRTLNEATGLSEVTWACAGNLRTSGGGSDLYDITQEEYCEWIKVEEEGGATACTYNASFDSTRSEYLTQHDSTNSFGALVGLINHCSVLDNRCDGGACVPARASDPQACEAVQTVVRAGKRPELKDYTGEVPLQGGETQGYRMQLTIGRAVVRFCEQIVDKNLPSGSRIDNTLVRCVFPTGTNIAGSTAISDICDKGAQHITVRARYFERAASVSTNQSEFFLNSKGGSRRGN